MIVVNSGLTVSRANLNLCLSELGQHRIRQWPRPLPPRDGWPDRYRVAFLDLAGFVSGALPRAAR